MRKVREITAEEEDFRLEPVGLVGITPKRKSIEPEPVGTIVLVAFQVTGYDKDCDGLLMARLEQINKDGQTTGWNQNCIGLYPDTELVVTPEEWGSFFLS